MKLILASNLSFLLEQHLTDTVSHAVDEGLQILQENLSYGPRSGKKHPTLPHVSSTPEEFPQFQSGELFRSTGRVQTGKVSFAVGFVENAPLHAYDMEFGSGEEGETQVLPRKPLARTFEDNETHKRMANAIRKQVIQ